MNKTIKQTVLDAAREAKKSAGTLSRMPDSGKRRALLEMAAALSENRGEILAANRKDLEAARIQVDSGNMPESLCQRLNLDGSKFDDMVAGVIQVASLEDPVGKITLAVEMDKDLSLYRVACPIGLIGVIFEARPDALTQITALCLKSGNAVILKGGAEAECTNRALFKVLRDTAVENGVPREAVTLLETREDVKELLNAQGVVDLIIPRGSNSLVRFIQENTEIPVLGHADGVCHIFVDKSADFSKAVDICVDAKIQYPAACNAVETILIHEDAAPYFLPKLVEALQKNKVEVRCEENDASKLGIRGVKAATEQDWKTEYGDLIVSIKTVPSLSAAIEHINQFGSHHTDAIITRDAERFDQFFAEVDSANVYMNVSTRFSDGFRYGFGAEVGISTGKLHPRGPVGLDGLVTYKYKIIGKGQIVKTYTGPTARKFTHKKLEI